MHTGIPLTRILPAIKLGKLSGPRRFIGSGRGLQFQQAIATKAVLVPSFQERFFFSAKPDAITLTMGDISHLTFESRPATRAMFFFVCTHLRNLNNRAKGSKGTPG
jgi:hypothetical protein